MKLWKLKLGIALGLASYSAIAYAAIAANQYNFQAVQTASEQTLYPEWTQARYENARKNALDWNTLVADDRTISYSRSMAYFWQKLPAIKFGFYKPNWRQGDSTSNVATNDGVQYLAHRGMVSIKQGIGENTLDAVQHAAANGINMVELDIQASSDGRPILAHDDTLSRVTTISDARVDSVSSSTIAGWAHPTVFTNPDTTQANTVPRYCTNGNQLMSLDRLFYTMQGKVGFPANTVSGGNRLGTCAVTDGITYFLDPKNLKSGKAAFAFIADSTRSGSSGRKFYVKTYDNFWSPGNHPGSVELALDGISEFDRQRIIVMPVISVRAMIDAGDTAGAVAYALSIVKSWSDAGVEVGAVEFPGAWDDNWNRFVNQYRIALRDKQASHLDSNPSIRYALTATTYSYVSIPPIVSYGYRFPDYSKTVNDVYKFYNFGMTGVAAEDKANRSRGKLGQAYLTAGDSCKSGVGLATDFYKGELRAAGCFVTTDFPLWEMDANGAGVGNGPKTSLFSGSPERRIN